LHDINLSVEKGKILALVGESGSGKTSLLRIISGLDVPDSGYINLDETTLYSPDEFLPADKRNIGYVFQDYALFPHLTVKKNIAFGIDSLPSIEQEHRIQEMLDLVNLTDFANRYPNELSGGEQQRVALARALAMQPKLLLLDEPFSNLDFIRRDKLKTELKTILQQTETTTIFVTHDTTEALFLADKIVVLKDGKILQQGAPDKIYNFPVNSYIASFFGKANLFETMISDEKYLLPFPINLNKLDTRRFDKIGICIRPNGFIINHEGKISGMIQNVFFLGPVQEIHVRVLFRERIYDFIIHVGTDKEFKTGSEIKFDVIPEAVHYLRGDATTWD
jgi:iron(III) transport system ATP-binding protein